MIVERRNGLMLRPLERDDLRFVHGLNRAGEAGPAGDRLACLSHVGRRVPIID
jgi:hypothetical protein